MGMLIFTINQYFFVILVMCFLFNTINLLIYYYYRWEIIAYVNCGVIKLG